MPMISTSYKGDHEQEVKPWSEIKKGYTHFANGDIGLAKITPCFENSKAAVFKELKNGYGAGTTELHIARPITGTIDTLFILLYLKSPMFLEKGKPKMTGSAGQKRIPNNFFSGNPLPFAPLAEQRRIVAKVDELMAFCDQLEQQTESSLDAHNLLVDTLLSTLTDARDASELSDNWARLSGHFDTLITTDYAVEQLKQTILQLAVQGKLVPQDPSDEPASELLKRIAAEKEQLVKDKKIKKQKPLPDITNEEEPFELPIGWEWCRFGLLFKSFSNGLYKPAKFYTDNGLISLRMYNIQEGQITFDGARRVEVESSELEQFSLEEGDLLINRVNSKELVGKTAIVPSFNETLLFESMNMRAKPINGLTYSPYLNLYMRTFIAAKEISSFAKEAIGQASINQGQVSSMRLPHPPLSEQHRIVAKVDELMALCDQLKALLNYAKTAQLHLADTVVSEALN
jgi:type I restriction enzyme S subunit